MPITLRHDVAALPMPKGNPMQKYGPAMVQQERKYAMDTEMMNQRQDYAMDAMQMRNAQDNPSIGDDDAMVEQEIRSGLYDPDTVRSLRDDQRAARLILRDRNLNATQQAEALANLRSRMRMTRSTGKVQPMTQSRPALQGQQPATPTSAREAFKNDPKLFNEYKSRAQAFFDGSEKTPTPQMVLDRAAQEYEAEQEWFNSSPAQGQPQPPAMGAQPTPNAPAASPAAQPQASYTGGNPTFGSSPVLAMPASQSIPGVATGASLPAQPMSQQPPVATSGRDAAFNASMSSNLDTAYDLSNMNRSPGTNYFNPENPEYARMRSADQSIVNPQKQTLGSEYKGRYGLGGADYGINPATGNRVTASVRPGGTTLEYDEPVGAPGTAMGGRKGSVNYLGGKRKVEPKKKAPVVGVDVSPNAVNELEAAKAVAANPNATEAEQEKAVEVLANNGVTFDEARNLVKATTTVKPVASTTTPVQPATPQQTEPPNTFMGRDVSGFRPRGWGDVPPAAPVAEQKPKPGPPRPSQAEIEEMLNYLKTGKPSDSERQIILDVLKSEGVSLGSTVNPPLSVDRSPTMAELEGGRGSPVNQESEAAPASRKATRTWTSADGRRTFRGDVVGFSSDKASGSKVVTIKRDDGKTFTLPLSNLSEEDRAYLYSVFAIENATGWVDNQESRGIKAGERSYDKPAGLGSGNTANKPRYGGETPKEVIKPLPSSSRSKVKRTS